MPSPDPVAALVLGAGRGERLGLDIPKAFVPLAGRTLIERSIRALVASREIGLIVPVLAAEDLGRWRDLGLESIDGVSEPVVGGAERQDSMQAGLASLPDRIEWVAVHDAARCLVAPGDVRSVVGAARECGAAILGEPARDTIKRVLEGRILETFDREACWVAQTPQVIRRDWLAEAIAVAGREERMATDDAQWVEWTGHAVRIVESAQPNPKITRKEDLVIAEALLSRAMSVPEDGAAGRTGP